jgi:hypothetical protein
MFAHELALPVKRRSNDEANPQPDVLVSHDAILLINGNVAASQ